MTKDVRKQILTFYNRLARDRRHRYRSWEHCFQHFRQHSSFKTQKHNQTAALHLAFYLASWGMYRGSSFLLQKDYSVHCDAVSTLLRPDYEPLWDVTFDNPNNDERTISLITSLTDYLRSAYRQHIADVDTKPHNPSDTLITKILLGTVGCTPACDRFFILGFRHCELPFSQFGSNFLRHVMRFYRDHAHELKDTQKIIEQQSNLRYPMMKLIDMYFWEIGYNLSLHTDEDNNGA